MSKPGRIVFVGMGVVVAAVVGTVVLAPVLLKDSILARLTKELNARIDAEVAIGDVDLSLITSFPSLAVDVTGLEVTGKAPFAGVKLASIPKLHAAVDFWSAVGDGPIEVDSLSLEGPVFHVVVDSTGKANYDVAPSGGSSGEESGSSSLKLDDFHLQDLALTYDDAQANRHVVIEDLDHRSRGDFSDALVHLETRTDIAKLSVIDGGVSLLTDTKWGADVDVEYEQATGKVTFGDNNIAVNGLGLSFKGTVLPKGDDTELDLSFSTVDTSFKSLLSLVPSVYKKDFASVEAAGTLSLSGTAKGLLAAEGDHLPGFDLALGVQGARFKMPDVPTPVEDIALDMKIHHPEGGADLTAIDVSKFHLAVAGNPVDGRVSIVHPTTDPAIDAVIKGVLEVAQLRQAFAVEGSGGGRIDVNLAVAGKSSDFEKQNIDAIKADGTFAMSGFTYESDKLPMPVLVSSMKLRLSPRQAELSEMLITFGDSDLEATGTVDNLLPYALTDATLVGRVALTSRKLDLRPFQGGEDTADDKTTATDESSLVVVPKNLDLEMDAALNKVWVSDLELDDVEGKLIVRDGKIDMEHLHMGILGGEMKLSGSYAAESTESADVDLDVEMLRFDLAKTVTAFDTIEKIVPVAKGALGRFDTSFQMKTRLLSDLSPDFELLASKGSIKTIGVALTPDFLGKISEALKSGKVDKLDLKNTTLRYSIANAKADVAPFALMVGTIPATFGGKAGLNDRTLDFELDMDVPASKIAGSSLSSQLTNATGVKSVAVRVNIGGTYEAPKVSIGIGDATKDLAAAAVEQLKEAVTEKVAEVASDLIAKASAEGDTLIATAEKAADKLRAEAKSAAARIRDAADDEAKSLVKSAKGNVLKEKAADEAAKKLVKEADKKADKLEADADAKADALVAKAKDQKKALVEKAQAKTK